ncbi:MAG: hypothetical protein NC120_07235 [Ruminococcus sp.]|nr:hypothetical protein [Ruminococcus sp.]
MNTKKIRTYEEMSALKSFEQRFEYLKLNGIVGEEIFGFDRYLNQQFYHSAEWRSVRDRVIIRDNGCDLGVPGHEICGRIYIHHLNPITVEDIRSRSEFLTSPKYLVCISFETHNAVHYGDLTAVSSQPERFPNDTCPWRR